MSFHTRLTLRASDYTPPDTGVSNLQLVAVEYLPSIEGAGQVCWSAPFRGEFFICTHPMPSPMRGRRHGEAVTDEVGQFRLRGTVHLISRLRRQLPLIGEAIGGAFVLFAAAVSYVFLKIYTLLINSAEDVL